MKTINEEKVRLRDEFIKRRNSLTIREVLVKSGEITNRLLLIPEFVKCRFVMCYVNFNNEVNTLNLIKSCLELGKRVAVPFIEKKEMPNGIMSASEIFNIDIDVKRGTYGIPEPKNIIEINPQDFDFVIVPGVAFDICGFRLGYGGGFYDRYLKKLNQNCSKVGLAYEIQIADWIPVESYDISVNSVITEDRII